ncbi:phage baseplate assembly protein V, partial [uncultured Chryseobacterium sp.]|uniref:phage baseplate assembly protein V n=1 Tax=uncultured Chryseobacterium sp. TaxID=259322 RepID=UPI0025E34BEE
TLTYGSSVSKVSVELNTVYTKPAFFGYNSSTDQKMKGIDHTVKHPGETAAQAYELNKNIFTTKSQVPVPLNANMELDVDHSQQSSRGSAATEVFTVSGETMIPFLYPGSVADLEMRQPHSNTTSYFTRIMVTEISHEVDALGNYKGSFKAIAEGTGFLPRPEFNDPKADPQVATVVSNTDPQSQGRIRVRFQWQDANASTHFIRMMSPDAGGTGAVQQNRGFVAVPEVGDQVMVGFEYHHPDFPFAMGGMFHGKNGRGGGTANHLKSIQTRSGIRVLMNDLDKSLTIEDPSGNSYFMDGKGNIRLTAPGNMEFSAGKDIIMSSGKNLEVKTGNSMEFMSGNLAAFHIMSGAVFSTPLMEMSVPVHLDIQSGKTSLLSEEETTIQGRMTNIAGMESLMIHSDQQTTVNSKGSTHVLGKDGNSHSNIPRDYNPLEKKMDGRCIVNFRPQKTWNGRGFGFDWIRAKDTGMPGDSDYLDIVGRIDNDDFVPDPTKYQKLISSFSHYVYNHTFPDGSVQSRSYALPYLTLYPPDPVTRHLSSAVLNMMIDIREVPVSIELEYDQSKFEIVHPPFPMAEGNHTVPLTVTCRRAFSTDSTIKVNAIYPGTFKSHKKIAGGLKIKANQTTYEVPVIFVHVITDIGDGKSGMNTRNIADELRIRQLFRQAYITPVFMRSLMLDMSEDAGRGRGTVPNGKTAFNEIFNIIWKEAMQIENYSFPAQYVLYSDNAGESFRGTQKLRDLLDRQLQAAYPGMNFSGIKKVFFIDQLFTHDSEVLQGISPSESNAHPEKDIAIIFKSYDAGVIAHELMHCLGLQHTFDMDNKFIFKAGKTDNVMDYPDENISRIATFHWQWKIMQRHARAVRRR